MAKGTRQAAGGKQVRASKGGGDDSTASTAIQTAAAGSAQTGRSHAGTAMGAAMAGAGVTQRSTVDAGGRSAIAALRQDHRRVEGLFSEFEAATGERRKQELVDRICSELNIHTRLEEEIFYPACRDAIDDEDLMDEAQVEHDAAKLLIADLSRASSDDPFYDAKVKLLSEMIKHHVAEEEKPGEGVFAKAQAHDVDSPELADELAERKHELQERAGRLRPTRAVSFNLDLGHLTEEGYSDMDRGGRSRGRGGWFGDAEGHSRAARERWEDSEDRGGRGRPRGRRDDDDDRDRGRGGWFGDHEGHSRAARERWEDDDRGGRSRSRSRDDDDDRGRRDHGRGGWFGDSEGHSRAARSPRDDDDDDRRGWHGDSRGHAEAARRGWAHRR